MILVSNFFQLFYYIEHSGVNVSHLSGGLPLLSFSLYPHDSKLCLPIKFLGYPVCIFLKSYSFICDQTNLAAVKVSNNFAFVLMFYIFSITLQSKAITLCPIISSAF